LSFRYILLLFRKEYDLSHLSLPHSRPAFNKSSTKPGSPSDDSNPDRDTGSSIFGEFYYSDLQLRDIKVNSTENLRSAISSTSERKSSGFFCILMLS
uniref:Uncharacterized protein n=1 Tax=Falco tinnunculus TaxID=100819 RepID=A0A8C4XPB7_FALTI